METTRHTKSTQWDNAGGTNRIHYIVSSIKDGNTSLKRHATITIEMLQIPTPEIKRHGRGRPTGTLQGYQEGHWRAIEVTRVAHSQSVRRCLQEINFTGFGWFATFGSWGCKSPWKWTEGRVNCAADFGRSQAEASRQNEGQHGEDRCDGQTGARRSRERRPHCFLQTSFFSSSVFVFFFFVLFIFFFFVGD